MVAFWDVLALVLLLVSIALLVLTAVLGVALIMTNRSADSSERQDAGSWGRPAALGAAGLAFLAFAAGVFGLAHPNLKSVKDTADALTAVGTVSGDVVSAIIAGTTLYALILLRKAVSEQVKQLKAGAVQNVGQEMLKIDRWMADNPSYLKAVRAKEYSPLGAAVAEVHADLIDQVVSQATYLPAEYMPLWEQYFKELIREWPQLEKFMEDHRRWYRVNVHKLIDAAKASDSTTSSGNADQHGHHAPARP